MDHDRSEIWLAGLRADRREFRAGDLDLVVAIGELIRERFHDGRHVVSSVIPAAARE